jgi:hypothetical protein
MNPQKKESSGFGNWRKGDFGDSSKKNKKAGMPLTYQEDYPEPSQPPKTQQ